MQPSLFVRLVLRESRGARGRMVFFTACLAVGVAAVVGVAALTGSLEEGLTSRSRELLAADLVVSSRESLPEEIDAVLGSVPGARRTDVVELVSTAAAADEHGRATRSRLVQLKVVDGLYPFYGTLELQPPGALHERLDAHTAVVEPELLRVLGLGVGDPLLVGGQRFTVAAEVLAEPDRLGFSLMAGPRVFLSGQGFSRTDLAGAGSRVRYAALVALPGAGEGAAALQARLQEALPATERVRIETHEEAQPNLRRGIERVDRYLGLVALLSLVLGGTGVARIVRTWLDERTPAVATLRCLGLRPREVLLLYLGHVVLLALLGSLAGAALGGAMPLLVPALAPDMLDPALLQPWQPLAMLRGLALGVGLAALFALGPLSAVWRVSPARVLRADAEPLPPQRWIRLATPLALAAGIVGAAWLQSDDLEWAALFGGGLLGVTLLLGLASRGVMLAAGRLRHAHGRPYLAHGLAALARPGAGTTGAVTVLGLGVLVVAVLALVQRRLEGELADALPADAPSVFLVDVQPHQWDTVRAVLHEEGADDVQSVPWATARLAAVNGVPVEELIAQREEQERLHARDGDARGRASGGAAADRATTDRATTDGATARAAGGTTADGTTADGATATTDGGQPGADGASTDARGGGFYDRDAQGRSPPERGGRRRARWVLTREQRLAWVPELPESNRLLQGAWFADDGVAEASLEEDFADDLGVLLGDVLVFDVQGVPIELTVSSLRRVEWRSFAINFFVLVEPGVLERAPHLRVATARLEPEQRAAVQDRLALDAPNVTVVDIRAILQKVAELLGGLALAVRVLGAFTVVTGLAVLAGAISSANLRRRREAALLKTLGVTRAGVVRLFATEYALVGAVAGLIGGGGALLLAAAFLDRVLELSPDLPLLALPLVAVLAALLATAAGLAASSRALSARPLESLRG